MTTNLRFLVQEDDGKRVTLFRFIQKAYDYAEKGSFYVRAFLDEDGANEPVKAFWVATMCFKNGSIWIRKTDIYKYGSLTEPCRDGLNLDYICANAVGTIHQDLDYICAWGATKEDAVSRVEGQEVEGRKRAARDAAYEEEMKKGRQELIDKAMFSYDPWGGWMELIPGLRKRCDEAAKKAYEEAGVS